MAGPSKHRTGSHQSFDVVGGIFLQTQEEVTWEVQDDKEEWHCDTTDEGLTYSLAIPQTAMETAMRAENVALETQRIVALLMKEVNALKAEIHRREKEGQECVARLVAMAPKQDLDEALPADAFAGIDLSVYLTDDA